MRRFGVVAVLASAALAQQLPAPHPKRPADPPVHAPQPHLPPRVALERMRAGNRQCREWRSSGGPPPAVLPRPAGAGRFVAAVITCADAAIDAPALFGLDARDLLLVSNAGACADADAAALVEWAATNERLSLVVVLTHADCPSLSGADAADPNAAATMVAGAGRRSEPARQLAERRRLPLCRAQSLVQCEMLLAASEVLRQRAAAGELQVIPASVDWRTGAVTWYTTRAEELPMPPVK